MGELLRVEQLRVAFRNDQGETISVEDVSFTIRHGETMAIVGESGCGKSVTSLAIMGLLGASGSIAKGSIRFLDTSLTLATEQQLRKLRGSQMSMIFQEPMTSLNPVMTIGRQIEEAIRLHLKSSRREAKRLAIDMLRKVGIPRPESIAKTYPHVLSGGMRQRVMIAIALICQPKLLIADEPTTALDVTIQAQIIELMKSLQAENGTAILLVTHDLGVVAAMADQVAVMYAGQIVEAADVYTLFRSPRHPYTQGLLNSIPRLNTNGGGRAPAIPGQVPALHDMPAGCRFHPRCPHADARCKEQQPELKPTSEDHHVRCWLAVASESDEATAPDRQKVAL
ncbi:ABC transporter ATP-binding protein [Paenibacillus sp. 1011MAR3C5]|uniref:ABC transporter ATP-binding protein n=1 Tax=Paenibacillus sp. 1011MAR3C5 TaxID=1675787 RepID=UPI000E6CC593|nr:ABC transporter ATP-binding protein [Paenibacillus sp. 1011MAR3C5]RJE90361.1 ABC transporter ATP-binding protein [Paenibacillus sp. 1011MAR3C5]